MKTKMGTVKTEASMFTFILILLILLPGAFIPMAIETFLTSDELMDMSVYLEDIHPRGASPWSRSQVQRAVQPAYSTPPPPDESKSRPRLEESSPSKFYD
jgi:hypothetical protein